MPKLLPPKTVKKNIASSLDDVRSGDYLIGKDGTKYRVMTVHPALKTGRSTREKSLTLHNLSTGRGINASVSEWQEYGVSVPARPE